jgi:hypothetical protein
MRETHDCNVALVYCNIGKPNLQEQEEGYQAWGGVRGQRLALGRRLMVAIVSTPLPVDQLLLWIACTP